jgi:hypothetical protein
VIRAHSLDEIIERRRREAGAGGERFVPLRLDFEDEATGEIVLSVGGQWDRRLHDFDGEPESRVVVRFHAGQRRGVEWFRDWLRAHVEKRANPPPPLSASEMARLLDGTVEIAYDPSTVYSALFAGGRRAGKTWIGVALAVAYAVAIPGAIVWLVAPTEPDYPELVRYLKGVVADEWLQYETAEAWGLANGSTIELRSAYDPEGLKKGRCDFALLNEGQKVSRRAYEVVRGGVVDVGGCVLVCANPPNEAKDQPWVADFAAAAALGKRLSVYIEFNALLNPHIDRMALLAMRGESDQRSFEIEVLGMFRAPKDAVAYNWIRTENERPLPEVGDVTSQLVAALEEGDGIERVVGIDVQIFPYMAAAEYRFFGDPTPDGTLAWISDEIALEGGDEVDLSDAMYAKGWDPETTLLVVDASGRYQHSRRTRADQPPPEWHGRGSFDIFLGQGWRRIVPPDRKQKRNPQIVDRLRAFTSMICTGTGVRRLFADPDRAPYACKTIREWKTTESGKASRKAEVAHMGDGLTYPIVRLFPRRRRRGKPGQVDPVASRIDRNVPTTTLEPRRGRSSPARPSRWKGI